MSSGKSDKLSIGARFREEREKLGFSRAELANQCGKTPQAIGEYERGISFPGGGMLVSYAGLGADIQYILTGVHSVNLHQVAEEAGSYNVGKTEGVGTLSVGEQVLVKKYRQLPPTKRTHAQAVVDALASTVEKKDKTGDD
jgi:transcriptional regulator with XRE-family HTH domain